MAYVYILQSKKNGQYYVGSTSNIDQRLRQYQNGHVHATKRMLTIELVFKQECKDIYTARKIEKRIKEWKRRDYIERIISDGYIKILDEV